MLPLTPEEIARRVLTDEAAKWFSRLVLSTRLVVIGVVIEGVPVLHEIIEIIKSWWRRSRERADLNAVRTIFPAGETVASWDRETHTPTWLKVIAVFGLICVAVGVAGEWIYEVKFEVATDAVQTFDSKLAGDAAKSAKVAHEEASAVTGIATEARGDAKDALGKAKTAQLENARAESDAAAAQSVASNALKVVSIAESRAEKVEARTEKVESRIAKLEKESAWRDLTPQQQSDIATILRSLGPQKYDLLIWGNTAEIQRFAGIIARTLGQGKWIQNGVGAPIAGSVLGVVVSTEKGAGSSEVEAATGLILALRSRDIAAFSDVPYEHGSLPMAMIGDWKGDAPIRVIVGAKTEIKSTHP